MYNIADQELSFQAHLNLLFDSTHKHLEVLPSDGFQIAIAKAVRIICFHTLATSEGSFAMHRTASARECHCSGFAFFKDVELLVGVL